jgi:hypothetical protein
MSSKKAPIKAQSKKAAPQKKPARKPAKAPAKKAPKSPQKKSAKKVRVLTPEQRERKNRLARERRAAKRLAQQKKPLKAPKTKTCEQKKPGKCGGSCGSCGGCGAIRKAFADAPKDRKCCSEPVRMTVEEARQVRDAAAMVAAALDCALEALRDVREASEFERLFDEVSKVVDGNEMA